MIRVKEITLILAVLSVAAFSACKKDVKQGEPAAEAPAAKASKKVLVVHSYHPEYPWVAEISRGIEQSAKKSNVELKTHYMDTKRNTAEEFKVAAGNKALAEFDAYKPDAVIAVDDNAQKYFAVQLAGKPTPVIFTGVNADPADYGFPSTNITGIIERPHFIDTLDLVSKIVPDVKKAVIISDDSPTSHGALEYMKTVDISGSGIEIVKWIYSNDYAEWMQLAEKAEADAVGVYTYHTLQKDGQPIDPAAFMKEWIEKVKTPTFGFLEFSIGDGVLLGTMELGFDYGEQAMNYVLQVFAGIAVSQLPVIKPAGGQALLCAATAKKLGVKPDQALLTSLKVEVK